MQRLVGSIIVSVILASIYLWALAIVRWRQGLPIIPCEPRRPVPWGLVDLLLIVLLAIFTIAGAQVVAVQWWNIPLTGDASKLSARQFAILMLAGSLAELAVCFASISLVQIRAGATRVDVGLVASEFRRDVQLGATAFLMLAPPMYLVQIALTQVWEYEHPVQDLLEQQTSLSMLAVTLITAVGVAPFAEEIFFRVLLQGWLENVSALARKSLGLTFRGYYVEADELQRDWRAAMMGDRTGVAFTDPVIAADAPPIEAVVVPSKFPPTPIDAANPYASPQFETAPPRPVVEAELISEAAPARIFTPGYVPIVLSAAIFAFMHLGQGPAPIPLFFLAIGLGYLYRQTHRATPSIVVHLLINSVSMAVFWFSLMFKE